MIPCARPSLAPSDGLVELKAIALVVVEQELHGAIGEPAHLEQAKFGSFVPRPNAEM